MKQEFLNTIRTVKTKYESEGFVILGVFGSFARGDETVNSDVDILYMCNEISYKKYPGLKFFGIYDEVKAVLEKALGRRVDLADKNGLNDIGVKHILPEVQYV